MKLTAFKIQNYRSIVNTGWVKLANDNITALIGQNESGKTSILEGLYSFFTAEINDDILRSDLSLPEISCEFTLDKPERKKYEKLENLPEEITSFLKNSDRITLNRKWINKNESVFFFGDDEILKKYRENEDKEEKATEELVRKATELMEETSKLVELSGKAEKEKYVAQSELTEFQARIDKLERILQKTRNQRKKETAAEELKVLKQKEILAKTKFEKSDAAATKYSENLSHLIKKTGYAEKFMGSRDRLLENESSINETISFLNINREKIHFSDKEEIIQKLNLEYKELLAKRHELESQLKDLRSNYQFARECFRLALKNNIDNIEAKAWENVDQESAEQGLDEIAENFRSDLPEFKLFEDFSSLLPNRIDLEDILNLNTRVEGFNAARNFLIVSGLDASFFRESNNRILKQKIENLNGEITLHFQGYWRQNLGRNNKIRLNFELEHYDFNNPEKKGKPYLEFWIKDQHERLYPKQRSRGVRWFLSFFLELKATALTQNKTGKILLIDEPGLSLHARAQEDVLKVFEDLKENIQILYSTHSAHLVNTDKIYRLLAVQRADELDDRSETRVYDAQSLSKVSGDTLSPIYSLLGTQISESNFVHERDNLIVEDTIAFYYLKTLFDIFKPKKKVFFLPSTNLESVPLLVNLMTGWKLKFGLLLCENEQSMKVASKIKESLYFSDDEAFSKDICIMKGFDCCENLFSTIDFKKYILKKRIGITENNSDYIRNNELKRLDLARAFTLHNQNQPLKPSDFDEETRGNVKVLFEQIESVIN